MKLYAGFYKISTDKTIAVISVDPSKKKTGGALLGRQNPDEFNFSSPGLYAKPGHTRR